MRGRLILLSLVRLQTELDSTQSYYHYLLNLANLTEAGISENDIHLEKEFNTNYQFSAQRGHEHELVFHPQPFENWFARKIKNLNY